MEIKIFKNYRTAMNHIRSFPPELAKLEKLQKINLFRNGIAPDDFKKIKAMFPNAEFSER